MESTIKNNWKLLVGLSILVLGLTYGVKMVQKNQENRSKAAEEVMLQNIEVEEEGVCGESNGMLVSVRPILDLCSNGLPIWNDSVAEDGEYNWSCVIESNKSTVSCSAFLEE